MYKIKLSLSAFSASNVLCLRHILGFLGAFTLCACLLTTTAFANILHPLAKAHHGPKKHVIGTAKLAAPVQYDRLPKRVSRTIEGTTVVDILLLYTPNIVDAYPGDQTAILLNNLISETNQTFVNSNINVQLRLVRSELVNYTQPSNFTALDDIIAALDDDITTASDPSLDKLQQWRDASGADIVSMIRTHDLDERDVCGVAMFPNSDNDVLANVSNIGISGGSNCGKTFTHEIGHNFGAGHQANNGESVGALGNSGALLVPGKFNTIMSSIGTGDINRDYKLRIFSNIETTCGGITCGNSTLANNADTIEAFAVQNAALREPTIPLNSVQLPLRTFPDADKDSVANTADAFPFDPDETRDSDNDGVGDNADTFPTDSSETADFDNDGIGNNADLDDDGDGFADTDDALPLDGSEVNDDDGDGVGNFADVLPRDFLDIRDNDNDGIGDGQDPDDDNDTINDFYPVTNLANTNLLVVSANTHAILEYDATTGDFIGTLTTLPEGSLTFRSDIVLAPYEQVYFIAQSDVYSFDRQYNTLRNMIDRSELFANFPKSLTFVDNSTLYVGNDAIGFDLFEGFNVDAQGVSLFNQVAQETIYRDTLLLDSNQILLANKGQNTLDILDITTNEFSVFATQNLDKPEYIARDSQGYIYAVNSGDNSISWFDNSGGALGEFVAAGTAGLGTPTCLAVGPDDNIYVCSEETNEILVFTGANGSYLKTIVTANAGGLDRPMGIVFVGKPQDDTPFAAVNDSDSDGVPNFEDAFPFDPSETLDTDEDGIGNNTDTDDDGDGMPDTYEIAQGFNPLNPNDARSDPDGDGISNLAEYSVGSNPLLAEGDRRQREQSGGAISLVWFALLVCIGMRRGIFRFLLLRFFR